MAEQMRDDPYFYSGSNKSSSPEEIKEKRNILNKYGKWVANAEFSDVKIDIKGCQIPAH